MVPYFTFLQALRDLHNEILNVEQQNNKRRISFAVLRNPDPISRLADETGDSIAEHSDDESMTNAPDTPDVGNVSTSNIRGGLGRL